MTTLLACLGLLAGLVLVSYLAACSGADRWLSLREWWRMTSCSHCEVQLLSIEWDGEAIYECVDCGKRRKRPL